jgi:hypothetical protein
MEYSSHFGDEERNRILDRLGRINHPSALAKRFDMPVFGLASDRMWRSSDPSWSENSEGTIMEASVSVRYGEDTCDDVVVRTHRHLSEVGEAHWHVEDRLRDALTEFYLQRHVPEVQEISVDTIPRPAAQVSSLQMHMGIDGRSVLATFGSLQQYRGAAVLISESILLDVTWHKGDAPQLTMIVDSPSRATRA